LKNYFTLKTKGGRGERKGKRRKTSAPKNSEKRGKEKRDSLPKNTPRRGREAFLSSRKGGKTAARTRKKERKKTSLMPEKDEVVEVSGRGELDLPPQGERGHEKSQTRKRRNDLQEWTGRLRKSGVAEKLRKKKERSSSVREGRKEKKRPPPILTPERPSRKRFREKKEKKGMIF